MQPYRPVPAPRLAVQKPPTPKPLPVPKPEMPEQSQPNRTVDESVALQVARALRTAYDPALIRSAMSKD